MKVHVVESQSEGRHTQECGNAVYDVDPLEEHCQENEENGERAEDECGGNPVKVETVDRPGQVIVQGFQSGHRDLGGGVVKGGMM